MVKTPLLVSIVFGGPALRPVAVISTSLVGANVSLVESGPRAISTRLPVMTAESVVQRPQLRTRSNRPAARGRNLKKFLTTNFADVTDGDWGGIFWICFEV